MRTRADPLARRINRQGPAGTRSFAEAWIANGATRSISIPRALTLAGNRGNPIAGVS